MGQLGFEQITDFADLFHDPFLVGFYGCDAFVQAVDVGSNITRWHNQRVAFSAPSAIRTIGSPLGPVNVSM